MYTDCRRKYLRCEGWTVATISARAFRALAEADRKRYALYLPDDTTANIFFKMFSFFGVGVSRYFPDASFVQAAESLGEPVGLCFFASARRRVMPILQRSPHSSGVRSDQ